MAFQDVDKMTYNQKSAECKRLGIRIPPGRGSRTHAQLSEELRRHYAQQSGAQQQVAAQQQNDGHQEHDGQQQIGGQEGSGGQQQIGGEADQGGQQQTGQQTGGEEGNAGQQQISGEEGGNAGQQQIGGGEEGNAGQQQVGGGEEGNAGQQQIGGGEEGNAGQQQIGGGEEERGEEQQNWARDAQQGRGVAEQQIIDRDRDTVQRLAECLVFVMPFIVLDVVLWFYIKYHVVVSPDEWTPASQADLEWWLWLHAAVRSWWAPPSWPSLLAAGWFFLPFADVWNRNRRGQGRDINRRRSCLEIADEIGRISSLYAHAVADRVCPSVHVMSYYMEVPIMLILEAVRGRPIRHRPKLSQMAPTMFTPEVAANDVAEGEMFATKGTIQAQGDAAWESLARGTFPLLPMTGPQRSSARASTASTPLQTYDSTMNQEQDKKLRIQRLAPNPNREASLQEAIRGPGDDITSFTRSQGTMSKIAQEVRMLTSSVGEKQTDWKGDDIYEGRVLQEDIAVGQNKGKARAYKDVNECNEPALQQTTAQVAALHAKLVTCTELHDQKTSLISTLEHELQICRGSLDVAKEALRHKDAELYCLNAKFVSYTNQNQQQERLISRLEDALQEKTALASSAEAELVRCKESLRQYECSSHHLWTTSCLSIATAFVIPNCIVNIGFVREDEEHKSMVIRRMAGTITLDRKDRGPHSYSFHRILGSSDQEEIVSFVGGVILTLRRGQNLLIVGDGCSGAGKSYLLLESARSLSKLVVAGLLLLLRGDERVECSFDEIYNDKRLDLLDACKPLNSRTNCSRQAVTSNLEFQEAMQIALKRRTTANTQANASSSRGHLRCTLTVYWNKTENPVAITFLDLAGSENMKEIGRSEHTEAKDIANSRFDFIHQIQAFQDGDPKLYRARGTLAKLLRPLLQDPTTTTIRLACVAQGTPYDDLTSFALKDGQRAAYPISAVEDSEALAVLAEMHTALSSCASQPQSFMGPAPEKTQHKTP